MGDGIQLATAFFDIGAAMSHPYIKSNAPSAEVIAVDRVTGQATGTSFKITGD